MKHELKSWPDYFQPVYDGSKPFDLRKDDRKIKVGDIVLIREYDDRTGKYTGRTVTTLVTYKLEGVGAGAVPPLHGLMRGYCILGFGSDIAKQSDQRPTPPIKETTDAA